MQVGKVRELCAPWGVDSREIDKLVETGAVRPFQHARGKGSLRLLDERSLCDVFFAHSFKELGVRQEILVRVIERLRPQYQLLLSERPERLRIQFSSRGGKRSERVWPEIVFDTRRLWECLALAIAARGELAQIQRGRPKRDWRAMFREAVIELSKEMQAKGISEEQIDAAIEAVRARRRQRRAEEAVVTIPPP